MRVVKTVAAYLVAIAAGWLIFAGLGAAQEPQRPTVPVRIEAEAYDAGVDGVDYYDTDGSVGSFRTDDRVDAYIITNSGASDNTLVGRTRDGEFLQYTFDVATADEFMVRLRVASGASNPGVIHVDIDGERVGTVDGDTDRWFDWTARDAGAVSLEPGTHVARLTWAEGANVNFDWLEFVSTAPQTPECSTDGRLEAEAATLSGRFEVDTDQFGASGTQYVAVPRGSGGWWNGISDNYVEFCVGVDSPGDYRIDARVLAPSAKKRSFYVSVDDGPLAEFVIPSPNVGFYETVPVNDAGALDPLRPGDDDGDIVDPVLFSLAGGDHTVRFYLRRDGTQLDWIELAEGEPAVDPDPVDPVEPACSDCDTMLAFYAAIGRTPPAGEPCEWNSVECTISDAEIVITKLDLEGGFIQRGSLSSLPPEIGNLTNLTDLYLSFNFLTALPPEIGNLTNLKTLNISRNRLTALPPEIGNLTSLINLFVDENSLNTLPPEIGNLTSLINLSLDENSLNTLPPEIGNLSRLKSLLLYSNNLIAVPAEIGRLTQLVRLELTGSATSLPPEIGNLTNLERARLSLDLTSLPPEIGNLTNLTFLDLAGNELRTLPGEFGNLENLETLWLYVNSLVVLPPEIGNLTSLERLDLSRNDLTSLPPEIGNLTNLRELDLGTYFTPRSNLLTSLPPEIGNLTNLTTLILTNNRLTSLPPEIGNLSNLTTLILTNNRLTSLPPEIGNLSNLVTLNVGEYFGENGNVLLSVPPEIGNLTSLRNLDLSGNELTTLPPQIGNLATTINYLNLRNNRLIPMPAVVDDFGTRAGIGGQRPPE